MLLPSAGVMREHFVHTHTHTQRKVFAFGKCTTSIKLLHTLVHGGCLISMCIFSPDHTMKCPVNAMMCFTIGLLPFASRRCCHCYWITCHYPLASTLVQESMVVLMKIQKLHHLTSANISEVDPILVGQRINVWNVQFSHHWCEVDVVNLHQSVKHVTLYVNWSNLGIDLLEIDQDMCE